MKQNIEALLRHTAAAAPLRILDFGCGPGRDLAAFRALGHEPIGVEGSPVFAAMAREHSGCEVWQQNFLALELPRGHFHGIFANASLFHVPRRELPRVLANCMRHCSPMACSSAPIRVATTRRAGIAGAMAAYHDLHAWRAFLHAAAFAELEHYFRPSGLPLEQQPWLASVWRRRALRRGRYER